MKEQFCTYEISLKLKEIGFDEDCLAYYKDTKIVGVNRWDRKDFEFHYISLKEITNITSEIVLAPLWQQVIDWLHCKGVFIIINMDITSMWVYQIGPGFPPMEKIIPKWITSHYVYSNPNEAREQGILKAIELISKENEKTILHV
jgi:hypothetical protein